MSKKIVAMLMAVAMAFSLLPVTAFATGGPSATTPKDVVDGHYNDEGNWEFGKPGNAIPGSLKDTVTTVDKTAEKLADNQYKVTLKVQMKQKKTDVPPGAAATVLVIDTSGSMKYCTKEEHKHTDDCYQWAKCTPQVNPRHYLSGGSHRKYNTNCKYEDGRYIYPASQTCGKEEHEHNSDNCKAPYRIDAAKEAAKNFLKSYRGGTVSEDGTWTPSATSLNRYVSVVWFNKGVSSSEWLDVSTQPGYRTAINKINALSATNEGTNLDAGLRMANAQLKNNTVKGMSANVVVLTDGEPTYYLEESEYAIFDTVTIDGIKYKIQNNGKSCTQNTYNQTVSTAQTLKNSASVYTVCFGASKDQLNKIEGKPTVGTFLKTQIATKPVSGSTQRYAYDANDTTDLYKAFAAISSSVVSGLNTGKVTDALPNGVSCTDGTFNEKGELTWQLDPAQATKGGPDSNGFITYTYEKTYKVQINPTADGLNVEDGYVPLNLPTKLTVKNSDNRDVDIPFPIPAGKVTYSLTNFNKELVTSSEQLSFSTEGFTLPANTTDPVVISDGGVTLLYKITVSGDKGAKFTVTDAGATLVSPDTIADGEDSTFSGTVGDGGTTVFYVSKNFTQKNIETNGDTKSVSNIATIAHGDNAKGPADDKKTQTVTTPAKEPDPQTYTVTYQWKEGTEVPEGAALPNDGNPIPVNVGETHDVANNPRSDVTKNKAGENGKWTCAWDQRGKVGSTATADSNIVITGTWTFTKDQPKTGNLIVKKVVSGDGVTLNDLPNIKITVAGTGTNSTYSQELTLGTKDDESTSTTAIWTIYNLTPGTYTVSEENAGVDGYDRTAEYASSNETDTEKSVTVTENQTSTMTVTNKYTKQEVVPTPDTSKPDVNKTATDLVNDKTDVTLSVGGKSAKENVAVMFLLDKSTSQGVRYEAAKMLDELATKTNTNIMYDVVIFSGTASSSGWQDIQDSTTLDAIKDNFVGSNPTDGTNMSAGILKAKSDIASLKNTHKEYTETYLITLSDGITYVWSEVDQGKVYCIPVSATGNSDSESSTQNAVDTWDMMYDYGKSLEEVYGGVPQFLSAIKSKITQTKNDSHVQEYPSLQNPIDTYIYDAEKTKETTDKYACGPEAAMYYSITGYEQLAKEFTKTFAYALPELDKKTGEDNVTNWTSFPWGREVMEYCKSISFNKDWDGNVSNTNPGKIFSGIKDVIYYEIQSGSITDVIGADFSLTDQTLTQNTFTLTVSGNAVTANAPSGNVITFGNANKDGQYPYVLTYYKGTAAKNEDNTYTITSTSGNKSYTYTPCDKTGEVNGSVSDEFFVLEMNVPVVSLNLKYNLSLTSKRTSTGTYEVPTNESATLAYKSANHNSGTVDFNEPTVSYTVKSSSGSHSGGSRPSLNTKDHYGYIIGYPVDYYTGQPTTDQTKKPVRPEGKITRAEVATIYFRMLTDESRTKFWSQNSGYSDVKAGDWFNNAVSTLSKAGIIAGYEDGSFRPNGYITRAEFATIAARFFDVTYNGKDLFPDISGHWAKDYINQAANKGFVNGYEDGTFKPDRNITRAEAVTLVNRTLDRHPDKNHFTKDMLVWPDNMDQTKWYYADMQEATNSHTYQMKENSDKTKYENWTKTLPIRNWEALEKAWSNANSSQGNGNVV